MKKKLVQRVLIVAVAMILAFTLAACSAGGGGESTSGETAASTSTETSGEGSETSAAAGDGDLTFAYFAISMSNQWLQMIQKAMEEIGKEKGFTVVNADADYDAEKQLSQMDQLITQGIDGAAVFIANEGMGQAVADKAAQAKLPIVGETLKIWNGEQHLLAPVVDLDGNACGQKSAQWLVDNYESLGYDVSDFSETGYIAVTDATYENNATRVTGFEEIFFKAFPGFPDSNKFVSDGAAEANGADDADKAYKQCSAILSANPKIKKWVLFGAVDDYALGAIRAVEAAGFDGENATLVSCGGERAVPEWKEGRTDVWKSCVYYSAMDFAVPICDALIEMANGTPATDVFTDKIEEGQEYGDFKISGTVVTPETYEEYYLEGY
ncbi:MAG: substrate-binding domain-containing protein [Clostridiales Family XIII bacterium]|jgi:L-arabinose transport system substrate-binding protein|nr:substrate-binding domain-containing protein [Clostridiales Family XIII bacterium]